MSNQPSIKILGFYGIKLVTFHHDAFVVVGQPREMAAERAGIGVVMCTELPGLPEGSVEFMHGHCQFEITNGRHKVYNIDVESASLMALLYSSAFNRWTTKGDKGDKGPLGYITEIPTVKNNYTLGAVLFG